jgi:glycosidase
MQAAATGEASGFLKAVAEASAKFPAGRWSPFLTNHDQPRVMTVLGDEAKARVAASAMLMLPGMPFVYYGEEIGMVGAKPDEMIRTPMQWSAAANGGLRLASRGNRFRLIARQRTSLPRLSRQSLLSHYRKLIQLRNAHSALSSGQLRCRQTTPQERRRVAEALSRRCFLIAVNFEAHYDTSSTGCR